MIVDANVLVSALLGTSLPLLARVRSSGIELLIPAHQCHESQRTAEREGGWPSDAFDAVAGAVVTTLSLDRYLSFEQAARARLGPRGQPDWPVLAAALALGDHIWSNDRDFFGVGVPVWTTRNVALVHSGKGVAG